jgi:hypothetical protein
LVLEVVPVGRPHVILGLEPLGNGFQHVESGTDQVNPMATARAAAHDAEAIDPAARQTESVAGEENVAPRESCEVFVPLAAIETVTETVTENETAIARQNRTERARKIEMVNAAKNATATAIATETRIENAI